MYNYVFAILFFKSGTSILVCLSLKPPLAILNTAVQQHAYKRFIVALFLSPWPLLSALKFLEFSYILQVCHKPIILKNLGSHFSHNENIHSGEAN